MTNTPIVYVIDDNEDHREILFQLIKQAGFQVKSFSSGAEFLKTTPTGKIGCILLDNQMPGMSGLEVQSVLATRGNDLPIVFISGGSAISDAVQAVKKGALGFLEKPIQSKDLIKWINKAIETCKERQATDGFRRKLESNLTKLTTREKQVYDLVIRGRTNKMIAKELEIKLGTVEFHRANMMEKMGANSFSELMDFTHAANPLLKE